MPLVGPGAVEGLFWATGHGRNGVLLAPLTASAVGDLLEGGGLGPFAACDPGRFAGVGSGG
jgi:glycine oxidase